MDEQKLEEHNHDRTARGRPADGLGRCLLLPPSGGWPEGLLGQPFYGWLSTFQQELLGRFSGLSNLRHR
jgi:hypothetical protein